MAGNGEEFDLSDGNVSKNQTALDIEELESRKDRRGFRKEAYQTLKNFIEVYLVALFFTILAVIVCAICGALKSPASMIFVGAMVGVMAGVPLSLAAGIRHMAADKADDGKKPDESITTAQMGLFKSMMEVVATTLKMKP